MSIKQKNILTSYKQLMDYKNLFAVKYKFPYNYAMSISFNPMDFFAQAVMDFYETRELGFEFEFQDGSRYPHDLSRYFRALEQMQPIETKIIGLSKGRTLDIGKCYRLLPSIHCKARTSSRIRNLRQIGKVWK
jgi:hypothetical protein